MKKFFYLCLAATVLFGCVQKSEIEDLQKQIDELKAGEIATIQSQIAGIQSSIRQLENVDSELRDLIGALQEDLTTLDGEVDEKYEAVQGGLNALASADQALGQRISDLKNYCDQQDNGVRDWVSLTFTTLDQHSAVLSEIATIKIRLGQLESALTSLDTALSQKISDAESRVMAAIGTSETSIKGWVNEQLAGYYTIAQADAKLKLLEDAYKEADESLAGDMTTLRNDLTTAVTDLTTAYQAAISEAITANNGVINAKIASDIQAATSALQTQIDSITTRINNLESRVNALEASVAELIGMVQSIVVVPDYSDGSVKMTNGDNNIIRFEIYPLAAAQRLGETGPSVFSLDFVETETKSSIFTNLPISSVSFDGEVVSIVVDGSNLPEEIKSGDKAANARLRISDGTVTRCSEYFLLSYTAAPPDESDAVDLGLSVKWAQSNLGEDGLCANPEDYGDYYAWGELEPHYAKGHSHDWPCSDWRVIEGKTMTGYNWASYKWVDPSTNRISRYYYDDPGGPEDPIGSGDNKTTFRDYNFEDDAARVILGGKWRIPTYEEWTELCTQCEWTRTTLNGIEGRLVTAQNGNSIFLPSSGMWDGVYNNGLNSAGRYASSTLSPGTSEAAWLAGWTDPNEEDVRTYTLMRHYGYTLRPVWDDNDSPVEPDTPESIEASPNSVSFPADGSETAVIQLTVSDGTKWKAVCSNSWIKAEPSEGTGSANITLSAYSSTSTSARSGKVTFQNTAKTVSAVVNVTQAAYVPPTPIEGNVVPNPAAFDGRKRSNTTYQLLVYTFADSDGDKIGDFKGIQNKLDYLDNLGVNAIWLSPIHPSDSYHGYDITDYNSVNPRFGTETDLQNLINAAHEKDIKIYLDYVLNHSGKGNPWFIEALENPSSQYRNWYMISTNPQSDFNAGKFPSLSSYNASNWHAHSYGDLGYNGRLHFALTVNGSTPKSIVVTQSSASAQASNSDTSVKFWIYIGDGKLYRLYKTSATLYEITIDVNTDWGFLVRTSETAWGSDKWGASTGAHITFGTALNLNNTTAADITFGGTTVYYYGAFGSWMPDFSYGAVATAENSGAFKALAASVDKWVGMGIDGLRLDAVRFIYENDRYASNATFLQKWYNRCNQSFHSAGHTDDIYMVGEAWMDTVDDMAHYYSGLPALFEFDYWFRLEWALNNSTGKYFFDDISSYQAKYASYRSDYIEVPKLSNHDETRAGTSLGKNIARMKQAGAILLTSPGEPYIYQGEELGYWGDKSTGDENVRTPILWNKARTDCAKGHSGTDGVPRVDESMLTANISVEAQLETESSILNVYRDFLRLRNTYPALATGSWSKVNVAGDSIAAWYRTEGSEKLLVIHNLAASQKSVTLTDDLTHPIALLGNAEVNGNKLTLDGNSSVVFQL